MKQYVELIERILSEGVEHVDRTGVGRISIPGHLLSFDMEDGFPLVTVKSTNMENILTELAWYFSGQNHIKYLVDHDVHIWDSWPWKRYQNMGGKLSKKEWLQAIKENDDAWSSKYARVGNIYGAAWRSFGSKKIDQLQRCVDLLKTDPFSSRIVMTSSDPDENDDAVLYPCHGWQIQFQYDGSRLHLHMTQRSADVLIGVPYNIASYALVLEIIAGMVDMVPGTLNIYLADAHLYSNHTEFAHRLVSIEPLPLPHLSFRNLTTETSLDDIWTDEKEVVAVLTGYHTHPFMKIPVAV